MWDAVVVLTPLLTNFGVAEVIEKRATAISMWRTSGEQTRSHDLRVNVPQAPLFIYASLRSGIVTVVLLPFHYTTINTPVKHAPPHIRLATVP